MWYTYICSSYFSKYLLTFLFSFFTFTKLNNIVFNTNKNKFSMWTFICILLHGLALMYLHPCVECSVVDPIIPIDPKIKSVYGTIQDSSLYMKNNTLVIIDNSDKEKTHSKFFKMMKEIGLEVEIRVLNKKMLKVKYYTENVYHNIIIIADKIDVFSGSTSEHLSVATLLEMIGSGINVFVSVGAEVGDEMRKFAKKFGVEFNEKDNQVVDYFNNFEKIKGNEGVIEEDEEDDKNAFNIITDNYIEKTPIISDELNTYILYKGISQSIQPSRNLFAILRGKETCMNYSSVNKPSKSKKLTKNDEIKDVIGEEIILVSGLQTDRNARVVFAGSLHLFSDKFFTLNKGNEIFSLSILKWVVKRSGVLKWSNFKHHKADEDVLSNLYRMKDNLKLSIDIHQFDNGYWVPYKANDVQFEYIMLDPYIRDFLDPSPQNDSPTFSKVFQAPDRFGVFKFIIHYERRGYTTIHIKSFAPLRNFKHNEYDRFLWHCIPFYSSSISTLIGTLLFAIFFLFQSNKRKDKNNIKNGNIQIKQN